VVTVSKLSNIIGEIVNEQMARSLISGFSPRRVMHAHLEINNFCDHRAKYAGFITQNLSLYIHVDDIFQKRSIETLQF